MQQIGLSSRDHVILFVGIKFSPYKCRKCDVTFDDTTKRYKHETTEHDGLHPSKINKGNLGQSFTSPLMNLPSHSFCCRSLKSRLFFLSIFINRT